MRLVWKIHSYQIQFNSAYYNSTMLLNFVDNLLLISALLAPTMAFAAMIFQCGGKRKKSNKKKRRTKHRAAPRKGGEQQQPHKNNNYANSRPDELIDWKWKNRQLLLEKKKEGAAEVKPTIPQPQSPHPAIPEESGVKTEKTQNTRTDANHKPECAQQQQNASHEVPAKCVSTKEGLNNKISSSMESLEEDDVVSNFDSGDEDARTDDSTWKHEDNSHNRQHRIPSKFCIWPGREEKDFSRWSEADDERSEMFSILQQIGVPIASSTRVDNSDQCMPERSGSLDLDLLSSSTSLLSTTSTSIDHQVHDSWRPNDAKFCQCPSSDDPVKLLSNRPLKETSMKQRLRPIDVPTTSPAILPRDSHEVYLMRHKKGDNNRPMHELKKINAPRRNDVPPPPPPAVMMMPMVSSSNRPREAVMKPKCPPAVVDKPILRSPVPPKQTNCGGYLVRQYGHTNGGKAEPTTSPPSPQQPPPTQQHQPQQLHAEDSPQLATVRRFLDERISTYLANGSKNASEPPGSKQQQFTGNVRTWANRGSNGAAAAANQANNNRPKPQQMPRLWIPMPTPPTYFLPKLNRTTKTM